MSDLITKFKLDSYPGLPILNCPDYLKEEFKSLKVVPLAAKQTAILVFTDSNPSFFSTLETLVKKDPVVDQGVILICYPKKGNPRYPSTVHRDEIFPKVQMDDDGFMFGSAYKFNRMLGFDDCFTLLEVKKVEHFKAGSRPSQSGADFIQFIPKIETILSEDPQALAFYQTLTPGYRKDWAVYIFSTDSDITRNKRIEQMKQLLKEGHKNMTLYRQSLKQP